MIGTACRIILSPFTKECRALFTNSPLYNFCWPKGLPSRTLSHIKNAQLQYYLPRILLGLLSFQQVKVRLETSGQGRRRVGCISAGKSFFTAEPAVEKVSYANKGMTSSIVVAARKALSSDCCGKRFLLLSASNFCQEGCILAVCWLEGNWLGLSARPILPGAARRVRRVSLPGSIVAVASLRLGRCRS